MRRQVLPRIGGNFRCSALLQLERDARHPGHTKQCESKVMLDLTRGVQSWGPVASQGLSQKQLNSRCVESLLFLALIYIQLTHFNLCNMIGQYFMLLTWSFSLLLCCSSK
jgi:hypothetical protein